MAFYRDDAGTRLPVRIDTTSNGEFAPQPLTKRAAFANTLGHRQATVTARRLNISRRQFLISACGAAASLTAVNRAYADTDPGGTFAIDPSAEVEPEAALQSVGGDEFIFDIQTHHVNPGGSWRSALHPFNLVLRTFPQAKCGDGFLDDIFGSIDCFASRNFIKEIFLDSDTDMAVLSYVPSRKEDMPLTLAEGAETRRIVEAMEGSQRLFIHGPVNPRINGDIDLMPEMLETWKVSAWKTYTQWGPDGVGFSLDDPAYGIPFIEKARELGLKRICIHKGLPFPNMAFEHSLSRDVGVVAKLYPDVDFIVYHAGYDNGAVEGPYDPARAVKPGVDSLVESLLANDIAPNSNVYAEIGSSWRMLMGKPHEAAHALGKLFKYVGPDNVLWGSDSIWYGSPQDQIQAFRAFQISEALQEAHGYPAMTPVLRTKVFGLNSARVYGVSVPKAKALTRSDTIEKMRNAYEPERQPSFLTYGPRSRREFLEFLRCHGDLPA